MVLVDHAVAAMPVKLELWTRLWIEMFGALQCLCVSEILPSWCSCMACRLESTKVLTRYSHWPSHLLDFVCSDSFPSSVCPAIRAREEWFSGGSEVVSDLLMGVCCAGHEGSVAEVWTRPCIGYPYYGGVCSFSFRPSLSSGLSSGSPERRCRFGSVADIPTVRRVLIIWEWSRVGPHRSKETC